MLAYGSSYTCQPCGVLKRRTLVLAVIAIVIVAVVARVVTDRTTTCYALFASSDAAERASEAAEKHGFSVSTNQRKRETALTFRTGETDGDAEEHRSAFRKIVRDQGGELGHPDGGCQEKPFFD